MQLIEPKEIIVAKVLLHIGLTVEQVQQILFGSDFPKFFSAIDQRENCFRCKIPGEPKQQRLCLLPYTTELIESLPKPPSACFSRPESLKTPKISKTSEELVITDSDIEDFKRANERAERDKRIQAMRDKQTLADYAEKKETMVIQTFSISKADKQILQELASKQERSLGSLIRLILKRHIKDFAHLHR